MSGGGAPRDGDRRDAAARQSGERRAAFVDAAAPPRARAATYTRPAPPPPPCSARRRTPTIDAAPHVAAPWAAAARRRRPRRSCDAAARARRSTRRADARRGHVRGGAIAAGRSARACRTSPDAGARQGAAAHDARGAENRRDGARAAPKQPDGRAAPCRARRPRPSHPPAAAAATAARLKAARRKTRRRDLERVGAIARAPTRARLDGARSMASARPEAVDAAATERVATSHETRRPAAARRAGAPSVLRRAPSRVRDPAIRAGGWRCKASADGTYVSARRKAPSRRARAARSASVRSASARARRLDGPRSIFSGRSASAMRDAPTCPEICEDLRATELGGGARSTSLPPGRSVRAETLSPPRTRRWPRQAGGGDERRAGNATPRLSARRSARGARATPRRDEAVTRRSPR